MPRWWVLLLLAAIAAAQGGDPDGATIRDRVRRAHRGCRSFLAEGRQVESEAGKERKLASFSVRLVRPDLFRYRENDALAGDRTVIWRRDGATRRWSRRSNSTVDVADLPAELQRTRVGVWFAQLLFEWEEDPKLNKLDWRVRGREEVGGVECFRIWIGDEINAPGEATWIWIGVEDALLRRVENAGPAAVRRIITINPKLDVEIARAEFSRELPRQQSKRDDRRDRRERRKKRRRARSWIWWLIAAVLIGGFVGRRRRKV